MRLILTLFSVFFSLSLQVNLFASVARRAPEFNFIHYSTENGLPSNCIRDIIQDETGFIWFATDGGLVRFDGVECKLIPMEMRSHSLTPDIFVSSLILFNGTVIAGTAQDIYRYDPKTEKMIPIPINIGSNAERFKGGEIWTMCADKAGNLWTVVSGGDIICLDSDFNLTGRFEVKAYGENVSKLYSCSDGTVWAVLSNKKGEMLRFNNITKEFEKYPLTVNGVQAAFTVNALHEDADGTIWIASSGVGLMSLDRKTGEVSLLNGLDVNKLGRFHTIADFSPSALLIGTDRGLHLVNKNTCRCSTFLPEGDVRRTLSSQFVYPILKDREGGLWVGTYYGGVNYCAPDTKKIRSFLPSTLQSSKVGNVIACFADGADHKIWIGSDDGGLSLYNPKTDSFDHLQLRTDGIPDNVHAITASGTKLWVGTFGDGVWLLRQDGMKTRIPLENGAVSYNCYSLFLDSRGTVWMASDGDFLRLDPDKNCFVKVRSLDSWIVDIISDQHERLWISTQGKGVFVYNPFNGSWSNFREGAGNGNLPHNHVNNVCITADGSVIAATMNGVARFDESANSFVALPADFPSNIMQSVTAVGNEMWVCTPRGLGVLTPDGKQRFYTSADGLAHNQFQPGAAMLAQDGSLYLGTVNGFSVLTPTEIHDNPYQPPVVITSFACDGGNLSAKFASLSYANPGSNQYEYMLDGFESEWHKAGTDRSASYFNLPPGKYKLRVRATNNDGLWSAQDAVAEVRIHPAWYATWWMKVVYTLMALALVWLLLQHSKLRREREHRRELDQLAHNQEKELFRTKLEFFTIVAHEIRTPVSLIIGPLEKIVKNLKSSDPQNTRDLNMVERNARRLLELVNQMLDLKKMEPDQKEVEMRSVDVAELVSSVADRFRPSLEISNISLEVNITPEVGSAELSPESFTKLLSNLLNNARKFTKSEIRVDVSLTADRECLQLVVSDNGIGIARDKRDKIFSPFYQIIDNVNESRGGTGLGLSIVKNVVESHSGAINVGGEPGKGAVFTVTLPIKQTGAKVASNVMADKPGPVAEPPAVTDGQSKRVMLVVDDNPEMLNFISSIFSPDYNVETAQNGSEALQWLKSHVADIVVCDWMMPVMDGLSLLREVRGDAALCHLPFVMLTAKSDIYSKVESMNEGADAYVEKPFSVAFLKARVENLVEVRAMLRHKFASQPLEPVTTLASRPEEDDFLTRLTQVIENNLTNPELSVEFIAESMAVSRTGLYTKIRSLADMTPNELIQITRLKKAAAILASGSMRINEVSEKVGFNSASYFTKCFQKQFGIRPAEFVAKSAEKNVCV